MSDTIRVLLAEDHTIAREGLRSLLEATGKVTVVGEAEDGRAAVAIARDMCPDVVVIDLSMPVLDGIGATRQIKKVLPQVHVIVLTMYVAERYVREAFGAGASGYIVKNTDLQGLIAAVEAVMRDEMYLSPSVSKVVIHRYVEATADSEDGGKHQALSNREREVLKMVALGKTNREVADLLNVSAKTVAAHRGNVMQKLELDNMSQLVRYAIREGLIDIDHSDLK